MGPSGPDRRRARDDEILARLLDPAPQRGPGRSPLPVREPGGAGLEPPETDGLPRVEARRAEGLPRRPRPEDRGRHPRREEGLGRRPRGGHPVDQGEAGPRPDRDRFARGSRGPCEVQDRRREMYRLFEWLRDLAVTSFVVTERPDWLIAGHVLQGRWDEDFLADGVIQLRIHMVSDLEAQRRLRVVKMRGTKHETGYLAMVLDDGRFRVTRAMST